MRQIFRRQREKKPPRRFCHWFSVSDQRVVVDDVCVKANVKKTRIEAQKCEILTDEISTQLPALLPTAKAATPCHEDMERSQQQQQSLVERLLRALHTGEPLVDEKVISEWELDWRRRRRSKKREVKQMRRESSVVVSEEGSDWRWERPRTILFGEDCNNSSDDDVENEPSRILAIYQKSRDIEGQEKHKFEMLKLYSKSTCKTIDEEFEEETDYPHEDDNQKCVRLTDTTADQRDGCGRMADSTKSRNAHLHRETLKKGENLKKWTRDHFTDEQQKLYYRSTPSGGDVSRSSLRLSHLINASPWRGIMDSPISGGGVSPIIRSGNNTLRSVCDGALSKTSTGGSPSLYSITSPKLICRDSGSPCTTALSICGRLSSPSLARCRRADCVSSSPWTTNTDRNPITWRMATESLEKSPFTRNADSEFQRALALSKLMKYHRHRRRGHHRTPLELREDTGGERKETESFEEEKNSENVVDEKINIQPLRLDLPPRDSAFAFEKYGYRHLAILSTGSCSITHLVEPIEGDEDCVLVAKVVDLSMMGQIEARQALLEAELLRRLDHPNIVRYRQSFVTHDSLMIVMEYCAGGDLSSFLIERQKTKQLIPEPQVVSWLKDLTLGLQCMHRNHILHCDLKSANIFMTESLDLKIGDLGISRELRHGATSLSPHRCPAGTPLYMSPEMCLKSAVSERSDCWALGCVAYEVCTLRHAFPSQLSLGAPGVRLVQNGRRRRLSSSDEQQSDRTGVQSLLMQEPSARWQHLAKVMTKRSEISLTSQEMLKNIDSDLARLKCRSSKCLDSLSGVSLNKPLEPQHPVTAAIDAKAAQKIFGGNLDEDIAIGGCEIVRNQQEAITIQFLQILPSAYSVLLNLLVLGLLEKQPGDRPVLKQVLDLLDSVVMPN